MISDIIISIWDGEEEFWDLSDLEAKSFGGSNFCGLESRSDLRIFYISYRAVFNKSNIILIKNKINYHLIIVYYVGRYWIYNS